MTREKKHFHWIYQVPESEDRFCIVRNVSEIRAATGRVHPEIPKYKTARYEAKFYKTPIFSSFPEEAQKELIQNLANRLWEDGYEVAPVHPILTRGGKLRFFVRPVSELIEDNLGDLCD